ncbi:MAG: F390 synthetase-related protein [Bacteroidota bacterium]
MNFRSKILYHLIYFKVSRIFFRNYLHNIRTERFKKLLLHLTRSVFYKPYIKEGVTLQDFPLINKKIFVDNFDAINTCNIKCTDAYEQALKAEQSRNFSPTINGITVGLSSGTSGNRGLFLANEDERARWVAAIIDRVIGFSFKKRKVAFFLRANSNLYDSVKSRFIQFHFLDLLKPINENLHQLQILQPCILVAQPSMLSEIAKAMQAGLLTIQPKKVISVAEVLTPEDNTYLSKVFGQIIHQVYQCTEGFLAHTCKFGVLHFNEDFLFIERKYMDAGNTKFHPVITDLFRTTQPVIRYELNDIITEKKSCECGSRMMAIESIEGRSDDMLRFETGDKQEAKIFPDFFRRAIITSANCIDDYAVIQKGNNLLHLFIDPYNEEQFNLAAASIQNLLQHYNVTGIDIKKSNDNGHIPGNKLRRIKNELPQTC